MSKTFSQLTRTIRSDLILRSVRNGFCGIKRQKPVLKDTIPAASHLSAASDKDR